MSTELDAGKSVIFNRLGDCLVFLVPDELGPATFDSIRVGFCQAQSVAPVRGVVLDCSGLEVLDLDDFGSIQKIRKIFGLLGAQTVVLGLRPGVVAALVGLGCESESLVGAIGLEHALKLIRMENSPSEKVH